MLKNWLIRACATSSKRRSRPAFRLACTSEGSLSTNDFLRNHHRMHRRPGAQEILLHAVTMLMIGAAVALLAVCLTAFPH